MAEISVERKSLLPWILGLALLALLLWGLVRMMENRAAPPADGSAEVGITIEPQPPALRQMASVPSLPSLPNTAFGTAFAEAA